MRDLEIVMAGLLLAATGAEHRHLRMAAVRAFAGRGVSGRLGHEERDCKRSVTAEDIRPSVSDGKVPLGRSFASPRLPNFNYNSGESVFMTSDRDARVPTSSIVMKAIDAKTFTELQTFVKDLESRPTERLLRDLPDLVSLSEAKAEIISYVIATKFRHAGPDERVIIRKSVSATSERLPPGEERTRVFDILDRLRA